MKKIVIIFLLSVGMGFTAEARNPVSVIQVLPNKVYIPTGFDDNDNSQIVFEGFFTNSCYKTGATNVIQDKESKKLIIENNVIFTDSQFCTMVMVPYKKVVDLGRLDAGSMSVSFVGSNSSLKRMGVINIAKSYSKTADDHLYAPVLKLDFKKLKDGMALLTLKGEFNNTCMKLSNVLIHQQLDHKVVDVLPVAIMENRNDCAITIAPIPFEYKVRFLPKKKVRVLLHVRSLSGQAVNEIVNL